MLTRPEADPRDVTLRPQLSHELERPATQPWRVPEHRHPARHERRPTHSLRPITANAWVWVWTWVSSGRGPHISGRPGQVPSGRWLASR